MSDAEWMDGLEPPDEDETKNATPVGEDRERRIKPRGKYAAVLAALPMLIAKSPDQQQRIAEAKKVVVDAFAEDGTPVTVMTLGNYFAEIDTEVDELKARLKELNLQKEAVGELIATAFETEGGYQVNTNAGKNITMQAEPYSSVTDRDAFREWCLSEGLERSLQLPWPTMSSMVKKMLLDGKEPPPGIKCFMKVKPVVRKANS